MTSNVLRKVEAEDIIFFSNNQYSPQNKPKFLEVFRKMQEDGRVQGEYDDMKWMCYSGVSWYGVNFSLNKNAYEQHIGKEFNISYAKIEDMLRCFAIYIFGIYIFDTIAVKVNKVKEFLTSYGDVDYAVYEDHLEGIEEFLCFIGTPDNMISDIFTGIHVQRAAAKKPRKLEHLINYIAIANEIDDMYHGAMTDEDFIQWFPIFFWSNITFIVPLRPTEMLLTPYECLSYEDGKTWLHLRRTMLKKQKRTVYYDVEKDYKEFVYPIPDIWAVEIIEKYQKLTASHKRRYLFDHTKYMINGMVSLQSFNMLLSEFTRTYLVGNHKYDYARYATGITEFHVTTAGDSRPIAMANLYYQDAGADICRQLADHEHISTSAGYYTNVSNTVLCASIMQLQRKINRGYHEIDSLEKEYELELIRAGRTRTDSVCVSEHQPFITGDIADCIKEDHIGDCFGCRYYFPSEEELREKVETLKKKLDEASKRVVEYLIDPEKAEKHGVDAGKIFLDAHSYINQYKVAGDEKAKEAARKWQRHRHTQTKNS